MNTPATISLLQLFMMYINIAFGSGILSLPRSVGTIAHEDMWVSVILGGLAMCFSLWCATTLGQRFPTSTAIEYHCILLGPVLGQLVNIVYLLTFAMVGASALRSFNSALRLFIFDLTPSYIIIFVFLCVAVYAGQNGVAPLIRMQQFLSISIGPFFTIFILLGLLRIEPKYYQPFFAGGLMPVLKGVFPSWFAYTGPELLIGLLFPFVTQKKHAFKAGLASVAMLTLYYTLMTLIVQGILGVQEATSMRFPTVVAYREVDIPDTFIERIDGYLLLLHIAIYFSSLAYLLYFFAFACSRLAKSEYSRPYIIVLAPVFYYIALVPQSVEQLTTFYRVANLISITWGLLILPLLLLVAKLRNLGGCSQNGA